VGFYTSDNLTKQHAAYITDPVKVVPETDRSKKKHLNIE